MPTWGVVTCAHKCDDQYPLEGYLFALCDLYCAVAATCVSHGSLKN